MADPPAFAVVALGSNLGDRDAHLRYAIDRLRLVLDELTVSTFHETDPVGAPGGPPYLNAAGTGWTRLTPRALLAELQRIEAARGRTRPFPNAPRTLDLDLILYGELRVSDPELTVPHPRFRERAFVLAPLMEIAPDAVDPVTGRSVRALWRRLREGGAG